MKKILERWACQYAERLLSGHNSSTQYVLFGYRRIAYSARRFKKFHEVWQKSGVMALNSAFVRAHPLEADALGVVCQWGIGDVYLVSGLARELKKYLGVNKVIIFTTSKCAFIPTLFPSVDRVVSVPPFVDIRLIGSHQLQLGHLFYGHFPELSMLKIVGRKGVNFHDCYKALFDLPQNCKPEAALLPDQKEIAQANSLLTEVNARPGRTVILCPDTTTTSAQEAAPRHFWDDLAAALLQDGFTVLTNAGPTAWQIEGTKFVDIPLPLFRSVALVSGNVVGNRSGICDLISNLPIKLVVLYPTVRWHGGMLIEATRLFDMGLTETALELEIDLSNIKEMKRSIITYLVKKSSSDV